MNRSQHHEIYYYLRLNRRVDEQLASLYRQGKVVGGVYSGSGQEAISVGTACALQKQDLIGPKKMASPWRSLTCVRCCPTMKKRCWRAYENATRSSCSMRTK